MINQKEEIKERLFTYGLLLFFIIDFLATLINPTHQETRLLGIYKLFFQFSCFFIIKPKKIPETIIYCFLIVSFCFFLNQFNNDVLNLNFKHYVLYGSIYYYDKYVYIFIIISTYYSLGKNKVLSLFLSLSNGILIFNSILILAGFLFKIDLFKSYPYSIRFGYVGLFNTVNEASYIYMIWIGYSFLQFFLYKKGKYILIFSLISSLLIGTKLVLLFIAILLLFYTYHIVKYSKVLRLALVLSVALLLFFSKTIAVAYFNVFPFWKDYLLEKNIISLITSYRDVLLINNVEYIQNKWSWINYFIGGAFLTDNYKTTEMDFVDIFLMFGFLGLLAYCVFVFKVYLSDNHVVNFLVCLIFACSIIAGGLFLSSICMVYLFFIVQQTKIDVKFAVKTSNQLNS